MALPAAPSTTPPLVVFCNALGRLIAQFLAERAHVEIRLIMKDGKMQPVHIARSFLPDDLPKV